MTKPEHKITKRVKQNWGIIQWGFGEVKGYYQVHTRRGWPICCEELGLYESHDEYGKETLEDDGVEIEYFILPDEFVIATEGWNETYHYRC